MTSDDSLHTVGGVLGVQLNVAVSTMWNTQRLHFMYSEYDRRCRQFPL